MIPKKVFNPNSKTHWWSLTKVIASGALVVTPGLESTLGPQAFPIVLAAVTLVDHVLRNVTTTAIDVR